MGGIDRGIGNRGTANTGAVGRATKRSIIDPSKSNRRVAQASTQRAQASTVPANNRTIFVADTDPFKSLAQDYRKAAIAEIERIYAFVGAKRNEKSVTVRLLDPALFPETFAFSDAVVATESSTAALSAHVRNAFALQVANATAFLKAAGVTFTNPFAASPKTGMNPDRTGTSQLAKLVRGQRAFPFMASVVALDEVMTEFVDEMDSKVHVSKVRKRRNRPELDARYWGSTQALIETGILSVLDNPQDPAQWLYQRPLFGELIGRAMAHEIRHLYVGSDHAKDGLGSTAPLLVRNPDFSKPDQDDIIDAIEDLERKQGSNTIVPTLLKTNVDFPF